MTTLQRPDVAIFNMIAEEDPMELSTDLEKRYLGDEDIDIDLGLGDKSPYMQEDEYMLEDLAGQEDGNDDEMADEVEATDTSNNPVQDHTFDAPVDPDEFDILVDDEDIQDADDDSILRENTIQIPAKYTYNTGGLLEGQHLLHSKTSSHDAASHTEENFYNTFGHIENGGQVVNSEEPHASDFTHIHQDLTTSADYLGTPENVADAFGEDFIHEQHIVAYGSDDTNVELSANNTVQSKAALAPTSAPHSVVTGQEDENVRGANNLDNDFNEDNSSLDRKSVDDRTPNDIAEEKQTAGPMNLEDMNSGHLQKDETHVSSLGVDRTEVEFNDDATESLNQRHVEVPFDGREHLHPVIIMYQESEISLFPPRQHDEEQSQTYFLDDESLAGQSIQSLLGAFKHVLAQSINQQDELELSIPSLGLDICETSTSSSTITLAQLIEIYLQLQHNDEIDEAEPLQMTLTTKLSFPHRLEFLYNAVAAGQGLLDITQPENTDDTERREDQRETHESSRGATEAHRTEAEVEEQERRPNPANTGNSETNNQIEAPDRSGSEIQGLQSGVIELEPILDDQHLDEDEDENEKDSHLEAQADDSIEAVVNSAAVPDVAVPGSDSETQLGDDESVHFKDDADSSEEPQRPLLTQHTEVLLTHPTMQGGSNELDESKPESSASSTLRGDPSDTPREHEYLSLMENNRSGSQSESDQGDEDTVTNGRFEAESTYQPHQEADGNIFYSEEIEDATGVTGNEHVRTLLKTDEVEHQPAGEAKYNESQSPEAPAMSKESSKGCSDFDNDELTYDDEDEDDGEDVNDQAGSSKEFPSHEDENGDMTSEKPAAKRDSLKRLRPGEDDELAHKDETQEMKRVRST